MKPALEGPQLGLKTYRAEPGNWLSKDLGGSSRVLTLAMQGDSPHFPKGVEHHSWEYFEEGQMSIQHPDASFDVVYLTNVLDRYEAGDRKALVAEAARVVKNGGRVIALSPACDDAIEAYDLATGYGVDTKEFVSRRLTNRDIARLRPHEAVFFLGKVVIPNRTRLVKVLQELGIAATLEHMWEVRDRFAIRRFQVGMSWLIQRK
jgi:SAM-dependent methyltransferase